MCIPSKLDASVKALSPTGVTHFVVLFIYKSSFPGHFATSGNVLYFYVFEKCQDYQAIHMKSVSSFLKWCLPRIETPEERTRKGSNAGKPIIILAGV